MSLSVHALSLAYGDKSILNNVTLALSPGEHVGLVGGNGVGKSTLLKLIAGETAPDTGTVSVARDVIVGYLPQDVPAPPGRTAEELLRDAVAPVLALSERMRALEQAMTDTTADLDALFADYDAATRAYELSDGYGLDARTEQVLAGLGLADHDRSRPLTTFSGGERSRLGLAAMLIAAPGLLLLDEPTNHLDGAALDWLEGYLEAYTGAVLVVSHDRAFLNRTVTRIIELDAHTQQALSYSGSYDFYAAQKAAKRAAWQAEYAAQQDEIKALRQAIKAKAQPTAKRHMRLPDGDKFIKKHKETTADKTHARDLHSTEERLRRLEAEAVPKPPRPITLDADFAADALHTDYPLVAHDLCKAYAGRVIITGLTLNIARGERLALVGPNGSGKSTLLRLLGGELAPDSGTVTHSAAARVGYLPQHDTDLPPADTLIGAYGHGLPGTYEDHKAELIRSGFFTYPELSSPLSGLSAGQRRKVQLLRLMARRANVLLLDEPTNHLSFDVMEAFEAALADFPGAVVVVSHDRRFLERFGGNVLRLDA